MTETTVPQESISRWDPEIPDTGQAQQCLDRLGGFSPQEKSEILDRARSVLSKCVDPAGRVEINTGLVVGQVQSGKTLSFTTLAALAHDNGYR